MAMPDGRLPISSDWCAPGSMQGVLADSGPLAALFNSRDAHHAAAVEFIRGHGAALRCLTTWGVISEVMYFLDFSAAAQGDFLEWLHAGHQCDLMRIASLSPEELPALAKRMRKYADRPMDLADGSLVWLANKTGVTDIITIDRADVGVYHTASRKAFRNLFRMPARRTLREPRAAYQVATDAANRARASRRRNDKQT
jgi:predicted nucleic acid-binding protein